MRTEYSYETENIEPFCDIFYIDCFYNSLLPILKNYGVDKKVILGSYVPVLREEATLGAMLKWECAGDRAEILKGFGVEEKALIEEPDICEAIKQHLDDDELVIVYIDCFYEKGRNDTFMKEHWAHTILVYGYDELEEEFSILEHSAKENLDYAPRKISYSDLIKCYRSVVKLYGEENKPSLYCYKKTGDEPKTNVVINPIKAYVALMDSFEETGSAIEAFKEKMLGLTENEEEYLSKIGDIVQFLTDVINSKIAFEYVMELFDEKEFHDKLVELREKWQSIRNTVAKNSYANKATPVVLIKKLGLLDEISEGERKLIQSYYR